MSTKRKIRPAGGADRIETLDKQPASKQATVGSEILDRSDSVKEATPSGVSVLPSDHAPISPSYARPLIDKFGRRHSASVLNNWSPAACKAMGLRPVESDTDENVRTETFAANWGLRPAGGAARKQRGGRRDARR